LTFLTDISGGYKFDDELKVFTGILYELNNQSDVNKTKLQLNDGNTFYYNAGVDYLVSKDFSLGANLQTDLSNSKVDLTTVGLNMRLEM
jgi:outer membrane autotransporter protein